MLDRITETAVLLEARKRIEESPGTRPDREENFPTRKGKWEVDKMLQDDRSRFGLALGRD